MDGKMTRARMLVCWAKKKKKYSSYKQCWTTSISVVQVIQYIKERNLYLGRLYNGGKIK